LSNNKQNDLEDGLADDEEDAINKRKNTNAESKLQN
jgi:hypothetical protein